MITKILFLLLFVFTQSLESYGQFLVESNFVEAKKYLVAIGTVGDNQVYEQGKKTTKRNFNEIGSGLITYLKYDSTTFKVIVTAKHVVNFFLEHHLDTFFIRGSWADTVKTTDYFGIPVPKAYGPVPNVYVYPDPMIDLAVIIVPGSSYDSMSIVHYSKKETNRVFPYNNMAVPRLGDQVWIYGYPEHVETLLENQFLYYIATLKPGYISWVPPVNFSNRDLNHITIVESNATHGNSGGPVFSFNLKYNRLELVGILVRGYEEPNAILINGKPLTDSSTHQNAYSLTRSGVSIIENAEYVKKMIDYVQKVFNDYRKKYHF